LLSTVQSFFQSLPLPVLMIVGIMTLAGFYFGKAMHFLRLPALIGFMLLGVLIGPSVLNLLGEQLRSPPCFSPSAYVRSFISP